MRICRCFLDRSRRRRHSRCRRRCCRRRLPVPPHPRTSKNMFHVWTQKRKGISLQALDLTANRLRALEPCLLGLTGLRRLCLRQNLLSLAHEVEALACAPGGAAALQSTSFVMAPGLTAFRHPALSSCFLAAHGSSSCPHHPACPSLPPPPSPHSAGSPGLARQPAHGAA